MTSLRVQDIACINRRSLPESTDANFEFKYVDIGAVSEGHVAPLQDKICFSEAPSRARRLASPGDVLVSTVRPYLRAISPVPDVDDNMVFSTGFAVLEAKSNVDSRYLGYMCLSQHFVQAVEAQSVGVSYPAVNVADIAKLRVSLPSLEEQRRIADFLDVETARIDNLIAKKRNLFALLNERINSRVLHHVGESGLVRSQHATPVVPIRRVLTKVNRPAAYDVGVITAFRDGQVTDRNVRRPDGYTLSASSGPQGQYVKVGDVVVHGLDGFAGSIGTSEANGNCSPVYHVCVPNKGIGALFIGRLLRLLALQGYLGGFATSTRERAVDFRNWDLFGRITIPTVSYGEQCEIGDWISEVRPLRSAIERSEKLAAERRQALITAVVTGQVDVSTASGRGIEE